MAHEDSLFVPRTNAYSSQQADQFRQLRTDSQWTDVTIHSQGTTFQCHRVIVAASSPVLKAMMLADMAESKERTITLDNIPPNVLGLMINYIYTGEASIPDDELFAATCASEYLQLAELKTYCLRRALSVMTHSNVISWYKLADKLSAIELKEKCSEILSLSFPDVCKECEFLELSLAEMSSYTSDAQNAGVNYDDLLDATLDWVQHKVDSRQNNLVELIKKINISRCSIQCLDEVVDRHASLLHSQPDALMIVTKGMAQAAKQTSVKKRRSKRRNQKSKIAVGGGHVENAPNDIVNRTFWNLDASMQFVDLCELEECVSISCLSICATPDGFIVTGGQGSILCMMFVSSTRSWKKLKCLKFVRDCHGSIFRSGRIYVFGGWVDGMLTASVQSLDLADGEWCEEPELPDSVKFPEAACMDGNIFLLNCDSGELLCLAMDSSSWANESQNPAGMCCGARMVAVHGQLMILGGNDQLFNSYHPGTRTWTAGRKPILKHHFGAVAFHSEKLYLIGGKDEDRVEEYDFDTESWTVYNCGVPKKLFNLQAVVLDS